MDSFAKGAAGATLIFAGLLLMYGLFNIADFMGSTKGRLEILEKRTEDMYQQRLEHREMWIQYEKDYNRKIKMPKE